MYISIWQIDPRVPNASDNLITLPVWSYLTWNT